jgi:hypothetical protein
MKSLFGHRLMHKWCLNDWFDCRENDLRRDDMRSHHSHKLL